MAIRRNNRGQVIRVFTYSGAQRRLAPLPGMEAIPGRYPKDAVVTPRPPVRRTRAQVEVEMEMARKDEERRKVLAWCQEARA